MLSNKIILKKLFNLLRIQRLICYCSLFLWDINTYTCVCIHQAYDNLIVQSMVFHSVECIKVLQVLAVLLWNPSYFLLLLLYSILSWLAELVGKHELKPKCMRFSMKILPRIFRKILSLIGSTAAVDVADGKLYEVWVFVLCVFVNVFDLRNWGSI